MRNRACKSVGLLTYVHTILPGVKAGFDIIFNYEVQFEHKLMIRDRYLRPSLFINFGVRECAWRGRPRLHADTAYLGMPLTLRTYGYQSRPPSATATAGERSTSPSPPHSG